MISRLPTLSDVTNRPIPIGKKTIPMKKKTGRTDDAVRIGCHAFSLCCLKSESAVVGRRIRCCC